MFTFKKARFRYQRVRFQSSIVRSKAKLGAGSVIKIYGA